ncbi:hypothetical protein OROGR_012203 [Orobanche gracilis]
MIYADSSTAREVLKTLMASYGLDSPNHLPPLTNGTTWIVQNFLSDTSHIYGTIVVAIIALVALANTSVHKLPKTLFSLIYGTFLAKILHLFTYIYQLWTTYEVRLVPFWEAREEELKAKEEEDIRLPERAIRLFTRFSVDELRLATRNFSDALVIGKGGFGKVYKGVIGNEQLPVAIKRSKVYSRQSRHAFLTEIKILCEVRHINLVSLIGYSYERKEMFLVYEYMVGGTLHDHIHKYAVNNDSGSFLTWKKRLNICIGAARGLDYLHTGHKIIHHDVKTSNILLDEDFTAKVADFGLAKAKSDGTNELESEILKGTYGYFDPHYITTRILTRKGDTYAFGVVLLEVLCERPALDRMAVGEERSVASWALRRINEGKVNEIVASTLISQVLPDSLKTFVEVAQSCLREEPKKRPTMCQIVVKLELALKQQDGKKLSAPNKVSKATEVQNVIASAMEQSNSKHEFPTRSKDGRAINMYLSWLWTKGGLREKVRPIKKKNLVSKGQSEKGRRGVNFQANYFTYQQIKTATNSFSTENKIGEGGFGAIYKGTLSDGTVIAVKQLSSKSKQGYREFVNEIGMISVIQHPNLIKLYGCCIEGKELLIIYEYMENNSLARALFGSEVNKLNMAWPTRHNICVGVAKGLAHLHEESVVKIVHRDIKATNVLLDGNLMAKISDFGLAKLDEEDDTHISTRIAGTIGYMAPEYAMRGYLTDKADVYSFGVLLLEVISGRSNVIVSGEGLIYLLDQAILLSETDNLMELVDPSLESNCNKQEILSTINIALLCTIIDYAERPSMPIVVSMLTGSARVIPPKRDSLQKRPAPSDICFDSTSSSIS